MSDEDRILAVLTADAWTPRVQIATVAKMGTDRAHYAILRLLEARVIERGQLSVRSTGRPQAIYRKVAQKGPQQ